MTDTLTVVGGMAMVQGGAGLTTTNTAGGGTTATLGGQTVAYILTDKYGNTRNFNGQGMPISYVDRNRPFQRPEPADHHHGL